MFDSAMLHRHTPPAAFRARLRTAAFAACALAAGSVAFAQTGAAGGPYRGLFPAPLVTAASGPKIPANGRELSLRAFGALERGASSAAAGGILTSGPYSAFAADVARTRAGSRVSYEWRGSSQIRRQPSAGGFSVDTQWLAAGVQALLSPRTTVTVAQRFAYSPLYSPTSSAGGSGTTGADSGRGADTNTNVTTTTAAGLSRQISRLTTAAVGYAFDRVRFSSTGAVASTERAAATLTHALRRALDVQLKASSLWSSSTGNAPASRAHDLTAGIVATPMRSRKTELTVGVFPGLSRRTGPVAGGTGNTRPDTRTSPMLDGFVRVSRQMSRNWRADAGYQRLMYYLPGGDQLISANSITGGVSGAVGQDVVLSASAGYSSGAPDQRQAQQRVASLATSGRIEWRLSPGASIYAEMRRDAYSVSDGLTQLPGLSRNATTSSVRVGMTLGIGGAGRVRVGR